MGSNSSVSKRPISPLSPRANRKDSPYYEYISEKIGGKHVFGRHGTHDKLNKHKAEMSDNVLTRKRSSTMSEDKEKPRSLYTVFRWEKGGKNVYISGDWDNWKSKIPLVHSHGNFATILQISEGSHQYKFYVDNKWVTDDKQPTIDNNLGSRNNVIEVNKTDFEVFDALAVDIASLRHAKNMVEPPQSADLFTRPPLAQADNVHNTFSPPSSPIKIKGREVAIKNGVPHPISNKENYGTQISPYLSDVDIDGLDYYTLWDYGQKIPPKQSPNSPLAPASTSSSSKDQLNLEPPGLPPQLLQVLLNRDIPYYYEPALLPEPASRAVLNHLYALSIKDGVMVVSCTNRYRKKYVTTLFYKQVK